MHTRSPSSLNPKLKAFAWFTVTWTYVLMVWGNVVSSTGSGLACPDWPLCHGTVTPPLRWDIVLEWGHRLLAASAGLLILATAWLAYRRSRTEPKLQRFLRVLLSLVVVQILLGGLTVILGLSVAASTVHLITASVVFASLIALAVHFSGAYTQGTSHLGLLKWLAVGLLAQFALGGVIRHSAAGLACPNFPNCLESFWPLPAVSPVLLTWTHRWLGVVLALTCFALVKASPRIFWIAWAQVGLGIWTVLGRLDVPVRAAHAALGYLLFGLTVFEIARRSGGLAWRSTSEPSAS